MIVIEVVCRVSSDQNILTINQQYDYVFIGDRPEYSCVVHENVNFLTEHPLRWEKIQPDGSQSLISQLATVEQGLELEFSIKSNTTDNGVFFALSFPQGVQKINDGNYRCVLYDKNNILLGERKVEIHVIQLFHRMEFQVGDTRSEVPNAPPLSLTLEEGTYTSVCKTSGSNPATVIKTYLESTELIGQTQVVAVDNKEIGPPKFYNVEKRTTIAVIQSDKDKILKCVSVLFNDSVIKEAISFKLNIYSANPLIKCENASVFNGARHVSLNCYINLHGVDCKDNIFWEDGETGKRYREGGERSSYRVMCEESLHLFEVISTLHIDTVTEQDLRARYSIVYVNKLKSVTRQQALLYKDDKFVEKYTKANIVCPLIPDTNESISWIYGNKLVAIQNNLNPILGWENRISVTHNITQRQFSIIVLNFTAEDQGRYKCSAVVNGKHTKHIVSVYLCDIPDNFNFLKGSIENEIPSSSRTIKLCSFQLAIEQSITEKKETLYSGSFKLAIFDSNATIFDGKLNDRHIQEESFICLELNEEFCKIANNTFQTEIEWTTRKYIATDHRNGINMYVYSCVCNRSNFEDNSSCHFKEAAYFENYYLHLIDFKLSTSDLFACKLHLMQTSDTNTVSLDNHEMYLTTLHYTAAGVAAALSFIIIVLVTVTVKVKRNRKSEHAISTSPRQSMQSAVFEDQENMSVHNEYEEIESVSYHSVNWRNYSFETNNQPNTANDESDNRPNSSNSGSNITMIHSYVNTHIYNSNEQLNQSFRNESHSNLSNSNGSVDCNTSTDNSLSNGSSGSETHPVHQYVNIVDPNVHNSYEILKHTNDTQKYETLQQDA